MAVKQVQTQMIQNIYGVVVGLIFAGRLVWLGMSCWRKVNEMEIKYSDEEGFNVWAAIMCLTTGAIIVGVILISMVPYLIQVWTNPDYAALQAIITLAAKIK